MLAINKNMANQFMNRNLENRGLNLLKNLLKDIKQNIRPRSFIDNIPSSNVNEQAPVNRVLRDINPNQY